MTILEAIILGIIQGLTEFLPVSSSGHLELGAAILNAYESEPLLFTVAVHAATALSTIVVFRKDLANIIRDLLKFRWNDSWDFVTKIAISMIPIAIVGVFFEEEVEAFFGGRTLLVGCMLLITALLLSFTYFVRDIKGGPVTYGKAAVIGIAQTLAIMPGISRSGSTIAAALLMKVDKEKATRFSFLMVLIPILGASALKMKDYIEAPAGEFDNIAGMPLLVGFLAAFVAGLAACQWMIKIVKRGKLIWFAVYCAIVGTIAILVSLFG